MLERAVAEGDRELADPIGALAPLGNAAATALRERLL
jgi:hypothetical protein